MFFLLILNLSKICLAQTDLLDSIRFNLEDKNEVELAELTFVGLSEEETALNLEVSVFSDGSGTPLDFQAESGILTVGDPMAVQLSGTSVVSSLSWPLWLLGVLGAVLLGGTWLARRPRSGLAI